MTIAPRAHKRVHYDKYVDMKMPRDRHKKPRLCSGNITLLSEHMRSMECKHKGKCKYCGQMTYMMCTLCGVHKCWKEGTKATNLTCVLKYHDDDFYGIGMEDRHTLFGVPERTYRKPSEREIKENKKYMTELRLKYEAAVDSDK
jgi:hypothetical protein